MHNSFRILLMIISVFSAHVIEVAMYALVYKIAVFLELGYFRGQAVEGPLDYFYFSIVTFTSLGLGDIFPDEHLRFITGIEALNGLVLIAWSGSFIFVAMSRIWPWRECE
ncbi:MAG: potassium channel family protein [Fimbriimonadaceae bacterium]|nr:potassium channel family protein [Alphaproteobacteria bacterium]